MSLEYSIGLLRLLQIESGNKRRQPIPVAARSKTWVCRSLLAGIVGSNLAGVMDVCPL